MGMQLNFSNMLQFFAAISPILLAFCLVMLSIFNSDIKGMLPYIGNTFNGDASDTMKTFNWKPINFEKTVLDSAKSIEGLI